MLTVEPKKSVEDRPQLEYPSMHNRTRENSRRIQESS